MLIFQVNVWNVLEKCMLASNMSIRQSADEVGNTDMDHNQDQETIKLESVKLSELGAIQLFTERVSDNDIVPIWMLTLPGVL